MKDPIFSRFFNLRINPFGEIADMKQFFSSRTHLLALGATIAALEKGKGLTLIQGEVGTGKTLLCKILSVLLKKSGIKTATLMQPILEGPDLLGQIAEELGLPTETNKNTDLKFRLGQLNNFFLSEAQKGQSTLLLIDEAHKLSFDTLETLRLLTNLESPTGKIVQIVLFAQPELQTKLQTYQMRQITQRVSCLSTLMPLEQKEVGAYIRHRIDQSGGSNFVQFSDGATKAIFKISGGLPRLINFYSELALQQAEISARRLIDGSFMRQILKNHEFPTFHREGWAHFLGLGKG